MLAERIREKHRKALKEERQEGHQEGRQEGLLQGTRRIVLRQIEMRFGPVPQSVRERIESLSSLTELEKVADRILTAGSLHEIGV